MNTKLFNLRWNNFLPLRSSLRWALLIAVVLSLVQPTHAYAASLVVNTLADELKNSDGYCSLREAIKAANYNVAVDGCPAGDAASLDTISFAVSGTINLVAQLEVTAGGPLLIDGGNVITLSGRGPGNIHGRVLYIRTAAEVTVESLTIVKGSEGYNGSKGVAGDGGGIYNAGTLTISNSTVSENQVFRWGGGVYNAGTLTIVNSTISGNISLQGGGIYNIGTLNIMDSAVSDNESVGGGGIINGAGALNITNSAVSGNESVYGGGIENGSILNITNSTLSHNHGYFGGGIYNFGMLTLTNSTLSDNLADSSGGGIYNNYYGTLDINNSTLSGNHADYGGGIDSIGQGQVTLSSSIITYSDYGDNCTGIPIIDAGYNIEDTNTCGFDPANGSLTNTDPLLGPLADNGGPTQTHALLPGSPAIDTGDPLHCPATDQRGVSRPIDGDLDGIETCDMGAYEFEL